MINHVRTLLLNQPGALSAMDSYPGEQYVPPEYRIITPPTYLNRLRDILFGGSADRAMRNWRLQELLAVIHCSRFAAYLYEHDRRITYWPFITDLRVQAATPVRVTSLNTPSQALVFTGDTRLPPADRLHRQWVVTVVGSSNVNISTITDAYGTTSESNVGFTTAPDGFSSTIALPGSDLQVRVTPVVASAWRVDALAQPRRTLVEVAAELDQSAGPQLDELFADDEEPMTTFRNLWYEHNLLHYRLVGLVLGMAWRCNSLLVK